MFVYQRVKFQERSLKKGSQEATMKHSSGTSQTDPSPAARAIRQSMEPWSHSDQVAGWWGCPDSAGAKDWFFIRASLDVLRARTRAESLGLGAGQDGHVLLPSHVRAWVDDVACHHLGDSVPSHGCHSCIATSVAPLRSDTWPTNVPWPPGSIASPTKRPRSLGKSWRIRCPKNVPKSVWKMGDAPQLWQLLQAWWAYMTVYIIIYIYNITNITIGFWAYPIRPVWLHVPEDELRSWRNEIPLLDRWSFNPPKQSFVVLHIWDFKHHPQKLNSSQSLKPGLTLLDI